MQDRSIIIIGAGVAGLSAGIYAQMNGYRSEIHEMHTLPGGLCTAWKRKGYTFDGCIHWLVGSSPESGLHHFWQEIGLIPGREFFHADEYMRYEGADGRVLSFATNLDQLERNLLDYAPGDAAAIRELVGGMRLCLALDPPAESGPALQRLAAGLKLAWLLIRHGRTLKHWMNTTPALFTERLKDPALREALRELWLPDFSMLFVLCTFAWLHRKNAGYPLGGSLPMAEAMAARYRALGGELHLGSRVAKILVERDRAVGVKLADGTERRAERVISAADAHATLFTLLDGAYAGAEAQHPFKAWPPFPPLVYLSLGVNRSFAGEPKTVSGFTFALKEPVQIANRTVARLPVHLYNQDPLLAPPGKTSLVIMLPTDYDWWKNLAADRDRYRLEKERIAATLVSCLEQRFPGLREQVEVSDVATPLTFERYTGNWRGSFEGWLLTPANAHTIMRRMSQTLPGLSHFYLCGQWVEPGGGLPSGVMSATRLLKTLCKEDGRRFRTRPA